MEPGSSRPDGARTFAMAAVGISGAPQTPDAEAFTRGPPVATAGVFAEPPIAVVIDDPRWRRLVPRAAALARRAALAAGADAPVTVLLTDDRALRRLNTRHRGQAKPTNVLSFPGECPDHLGDVALAHGVVRREARATGKRPAAHFAHLVAHGTLHLLGYDHLAAGEARRMERAEARAMARLRLPNPWRGAA